MRQWIWLTASRRQSENQTHWLSDLVLPLLFTILTMACLLLFSLETIASNDASFMKKDDGYNKKTYTNNASPVVSAFSA